MEQERVRELCAPLLAWYDRHRRTLPWRSDPRPYRVWVSEIMLQQTRVSAAIDYFERFMQAFPDVASLAAADEESLLKLWQGLGYYNRARNLQKGAREVMERYGGVIPGDWEQLRALSGVGDYTAGAIAAIAFGQKTPAVDGNVLRVLSRITGDERDILQASLRAEYTELLRPLMPDGREGDFVQALMELGALTCIPGGAPDCAHCPAGAFCKARADGTTDTIPHRAKKPARKRQTRLVYLVFYQNRVLLRRRQSQGLLAGLWEFPSTGKGEEPPYGLNAETLVKGPDAKHIFTHIEWRMHAFLAYPKRFSCPADCVFADERMLDERYAVPSAFREYVKLARRVLSGEKEGI